MINNASYSFLPIFTAMPTVPITDIREHTISCENPDKMRKEIIMSHQIDYKIAYFSISLVSRLALLPFIILGLYAAYAE